MITSETIAMATERMRNRRILNSCHVSKNYIVIRYNVGNKIQEKRITTEEMRKAYRKAVENVNGVNENI